MKLIEGRRYQTQDGQVTEPVFGSMHGEHPYRAWVAGRYRDYTSDGRCIDNEDSSEFDLVEESSQNVINKEHVESVIDLIQGNKVYTKLEDVDVEAYNLAEELIKAQALEIDRLRSIIAQYEEIEKEIK